MRKLGKRLFLERSACPILALSVENVAFTAELANEEVDGENEAYHSGATHPGEFTMP